MKRSSAAQRAAIRRGQVERFGWELNDVTVSIRILADRIDDLGQLGMTIGQRRGAAMNPDQLACYASNTLQGTLALLRDLRRATRLPAGKRGWK